MQHVENKWFKNLFYRVIIFLSVDYQSIAVLLEQFNE